MSRSYVFFLISISYSIIGDVWTTLYGLSVGLVETNILYKNYGWSMTILYFILYHVGIALLVTLLEKKKLVAGVAIAAIAMVITGSITVFRNLSVITTHLGHTVRG